MKDGDKVELFENHIKLHDYVWLSRASAEVFARARPTTRFESDPERPALIRATTAGAHDVQP